jgi:hypothetical protein
MMASLRRVYLYLVLAGALSASAVALARVLHPLLWLVGIPDATRYVVTSSGEAVATPIFQGPGAPPPGQQVRDALPALLVALAVAAPLLALHYWLLRRDERRDPTARGAIERVILLDLATIGFGAVVVSAGVTAAASWLQAVPGAMLLVYNRDHVGNQQASPLAYALAFGMPLLVTALERRRTRNPSDIAQRLSWALFALPQAVLLFPVVLIGGGALQEVLQALALSAAYAPCVSGRVLCMGGPAMFTTTNSLGQALVVLAAFAGAVLLTSKDSGTLVGVIRTALLVAVAMLLAVAFFGYWVSNYLTFTLPYLGQPNYAAFNVLGFQYGTLFAAVGSLAWTVLQARRQTFGADHAWARRVILVAASLAPLGALVIGLVNVISMIAASAGGAEFNDQARNIAIGQLCAVLLLLVILPLLAREWHWLRATGSGAAGRAVRQLP